jgi:hypothetical protein
VRAWLGRHPWWAFHFPPASASWLDAFEGFFDKLAKRRPRRGLFNPTRRRSPSGEVHD